MGKIFLGVIILMAFLVVGGIFIVSAEEAQVSNLVDSFTGKNVSVQVESYIQDFISKRGVVSENIKDIKEVDFNSLPKEVNIENVGENNLAIYEVDYDNSGKDEKVFVISYSVEKLKAQGDLIVASDKRQFLNFGFSGIMKNSDFLTTATGVETSTAKGYIMMRKGSITAISTNLEIIQGNPGKIEIIILKNGEPISFGNTIDSDSLGVKKDYDVQSKGVVNFEPGDVISAYANIDADIAWRDVITLIEITTLD